MFDLWVPQRLYRYWPALLIIAGAYLVLSYYRSNLAPRAKTVYRTPPPSVITSNLDRGARDFAGNREH
jgi:hypothetical protein